MHDSQLLSSEVLFPVIGAAVENPEHGLLVEVLNLGLDRLNVCYAVAVRKSKFVTANSRSRR